ncbi:IS1634 family transposase [Limnochorda pilosa]|uniref:Transposase n=1 Tax=Limnochorda pilosa TaxID=1555112 RepID=A0A0K2SN21_LIMPI|nr:IS1634 family transposase [Limnochorda pilosa]BAS28209.1 transposase [Limnochorda pilosa]
MYLRTVRSKGTEYVQLAHNRRVGGQTRSEILYSFGRKDQLDLDALRRLVKSISRFLEPEEVEKIQEELGMDWPFEFLGSRKLGGTWLLDGLWRGLKLDEAFNRLLSPRGYRTPVERLIFAMVANRALAPASKLAMEHWVANEVWIEGLPEVEVHQLYRAMDFLLEAHDEIQRDVFYAVANLLNLEVDLLFIDTTSTYFEIEGEDPDGDEADGFRKRGRSKDGQPGLAQVVIGFAVTRDGIPVRCWVWPGNTSDMNVVEEVKRDLNGWKLGRVVVVMDTGFNSDENRRILQGTGDAYIIGEKMRLGKDGKPHEALKRAGTYKKLENGLEIKEVVVQPGSVAHRRFVVVYNPEEAERDRKKREDIVAEAERRLAELGNLEGKEHTKAVCELRAHATYGRYLRQAKNGALEINRAKIRQEEKLDGKFLVSTSDDGLSTEDVVAGYKQLWQIERVNRQLKHTVDIRPVYHRLEDRIRAHVLLCWLALLVIRVAENETQCTWYEMKRILSTLELGIHQTRHGELWTNRVTEEQKALFQALHIKPPARYLAIPTPRSA